MLKKFSIANQRPAHWIYWPGIMLYLGFSMLHFYTYVPELATDFVSYLTLAKKYSEGNFFEALNAYWSPLISWLLTPFCFVGIDPVSSFKILHILAGLFFLWLIHKLSDRFNLNPTTRIVCFYTFCAFAFFYQSTAFTPDFLSSTFVLLYIYLLIHPDRHKDRWYFAKTGSAAVLGFFAKNYFLAFFICQFSLFTALELYFFPAQKNVLLKNVAKTFLVFFFLVGIWVSLLSFKYERFVISSSGSYNFSLIVSADKPGDKPQYYDIGLLPPPDVHSVSSWDDPTYYPVKTRSLFQSWESILFQLKIIQYNAGLLPYLFKWFSYLGLALVLVCLYPFFFRDRPSGHAALIIAASAFIYIGGYLLIFYEERYVLPAYFLFIFSAFYVLDDVMSRIALPDIMYALLSCLLAVSFLKNPYHVYQERKAALPEAYFYRDGALNLKNTPWLKNKRLASSNEYELTGLIAFLNEGYSYGCLNKNSSDQENWESLKKYQVDYFLYFRCRRPFVKKECKKEIPFYLINKKIVYQDEALQLYVYKLK